MLTKKIKVKQPRRKPISTKKHADPVVTNKVNAIAHAELKLVDVDGEVQKAGEDFIIEGFASTEDLDRGYDVTHAEAFTKAIDMYMLNPVMLYMHNMTDPIGKIVSASVVKGKGLFVRGYVSKDAVGVRQKIVEGILRAFSFGFNITKFHEEKPGASQRIIRHITGLELLEISIVSIPMNQRALFSMAKGLQEGTDIEYAKSDSEYVQELELKLNEVDNLKIQLQEVNELKAQVESLMERKDDDGGVVPEGEPDGDPLDNIQKAVVPFTDQGVVEDLEYAYDTGEEVRNADIKRLFDMCGWFDIDNSEVKDGYKLPHHRESDCKVVWAAVQMRMGELLGMHGGVNIPEDDKKDVWNHLAKHYEQFDKVAPDYKDDYSDDELRSLITEGLIKKMKTDERKAKDPDGNLSTSDISGDIRVALYKKHNIKDGDWAWVVDLFPINYPDGHAIASIQKGDKDEKFFSYNYAYKGETVTLSDEKELEQEWVEKNIEWEETEIKAGRVISARNLKKIESAVTAIDSCKSSLVNLLEANKDERNTGAGDNDNTPKGDKGADDDKDAQEVLDFLQEQKSDEEIESLTDDMNELINGIRKMGSSVA